MVAANGADNKSNNDNKHSHSFGVFLALKPHTGTGHTLNMLFAITDDKCMDSEQCRLQMPAQFGILV